LRRRDCYCAALDIRPDKPALLQPPGKRQAPRPSCQMIFKISYLRPLKTKICPDNGSCFKTSCTRSAREGNPQRMSVYPVESQTLTPVPIGNGFTAAPPVRAGSEAAPQRRHRGPRSHGDDCADNLHKPTS
jgi:hypothetical protein